MFDRLTLADAARCMDLAERVGWPREDAKWRMLLTLGAGHCTREGDALTSMVVITPHDEGSFVAMMVVDPSLHGRGVGRALLEHAMERAQRPVMLYATDIGRKLYEKLGFIEVDAVTRFFGTAPVPTRRERKRPPTVESLIKADAQAFGFARPGMLRSLHDLADHITGDTDSFALRWSNGAMNIIGPVVAPTEDQAIALIEDTLSGPCRIDVPVGSTRVAAHLRARGFVDRGRAPLMTWPAADLRGDRARYHAIALQAFG